MKNLWLILLTTMILSGANAAADATAASVNLGARYGTATKDTMIFANNTGNGAGGAPGFFAGTNSGANGARRGLLSFDVSSIPASSIITDVELTLFIGQIAGSGGGAGGGGTQGPVIGLHELFVPWGEANTGASTADNLGGTGQGQLAQVGDATWLERFSDGNSANLVDPWTAPGGLAGVDFDAVASASLVQGNQRYDQSTWLSTAALVADVQGWLDNPATNYGWMLVNTDETGTQTFRGFYSRNFNPPAIPTNPPIPAGSPLTEVADFWPVLTVTYIVPEPTTFLLVVMGLSCFVDRRVMSFR
jgi:hypothetical protein